jgi:hypothetical protein
VLVERRHLADDVITNAARSESILCGIAAGSTEHRLKSLCATQVSRPVFRAGALQLAKGAG